MFPLIATNVRLTEQSGAEAVPHTLPTAQPVGMNRSIRTVVLSRLPVQLPAMESAFARAGAEVDVGRGGGVSVAARAVGVVVGSRVAVSVGGIAVVGSGVGEGEGVLVVATWNVVAVALGGIEGEAASAVAVSSAG